MAKELRRKIRYAMACTLVCTCASMPLANADEFDPVSTYGLAHIVSAHLANPDTMTIDVAPVSINHRTLYVADFYGDGLIRYVLKDLPEFDGARIRISMRKMSDIVSGAALGAIQQARRIKAENGAIVLEAEQGEITIEQDMNQIEMKRLHFYQPAWVVPSRKTLKKNRLKMGVQVARLQGVPEQ